MATAVLGEALRRNENRKRDKRHGSILGDSPATRVQSDSRSGGHLRRVQCQFRRRAERSARSAERGDKAGEAVASFGGSMLRVHRRVRIEPVVHEKSA